MSSRPTTPRALGPSTSKETGSRIAGRSHRGAPSGEGLRVKTGVRAPARIETAHGRIEVDKNAPEQAMVGIGAWLKRWDQCPCGSDEHQRGGHTAETAFSAEGQARYLACLDLPPIEDALAASLNMIPLVPLIRCTNPKACGHCWYCKQAEARS